MKPILLLLCFSFLNICAFADIVTFKGKSFDPKIEDVWIGEFPSIYNLYPTDGSILAESNKNTKGEFFLSFNLENEKILHFKMLGLAVDLYVSPGDSLQFEISTDGKVRFYGERAAYYNYPFMVSEQFQYKDSPSYAKVNNLEMYHSMVNQWHKRRVDFLNQYAADNSVSEEFVDAEKSELLYEKQHYLLTPLIYNGFFKKDLPKEYLSDMQSININEIQKFGSGSVTLYLLYQDVVDYQEGKAELFGDYFVKEPNQKEILSLINLIGYYSVGKKGKYYNQLKVAIEYASKHAKDELWLAYLRKMEKNFNVTNNTFPADLLEDTVLTRLSDNKEITFKYLLEQHKGTPVYVDFWASWCSPCIENIRESGEVKALLKDINVPIIYISLDKNRSSWAKSAKNEGIEKNQYLIKDDFHSLLAHYLSIQTIPHYIILDRKHKVKEQDAPRPVKSSIDKLKSIFLAMDNESKEQESEPTVITY